jgi:hypothetical protein
MGTNWNIATLLHRFHQTFSFYLIGTDYWHWRRGKTSIRGEAPDEIPYSTYYTVILRFVILNEETELKRHRSGRNTCRKDI